MNHTDRQTFPLSSIHPGWTGERILAIEHPLRRGLVRLSDQLGGADAAIIVVLTEFDYDGMLETIEAIEPIHVGTDSVARTHSMLEEYRRAINARYPALTPDSESVYPLNVMPATRAVVPGTFPRQVAGFRLANRALHRSVYLRLHIVERGEDPDSILSEILKLDGIQEALIDYVARLERFP